MDGRAYLHERGITIAAQLRGGIVHEYWRDVLKEWLCKHGFEVTEEHRIDLDASVDLHGTKNGGDIYVEIETGHSDIPANVQKCLRLQGTVIFFFTSRALASKTSKTLLPARFTVMTPDNLAR